MNSHSSYAEEYLNSNLTLENQYRPIRLGRNNRLDPPYDRSKSRSKGISISKPISRSSPQPKPVSKLKSAQSYCLKGSQLPKSEKKSPLELGCQSSAQAQFRITPLAKLERHSNQGRVQFQAPSPDYDCSGRVHSKLTANFGSQPPLSRVKSFGVIPEPSYSSASSRLSRREIYNSQQQLNSHRSPVTISFKSSSPCRPDPLVSKNLSTVEFHPRKPVTNDRTKLDGFPKERNLIEALGEYGQQVTRIHNHKLTKQSQQTQDGEDLVPHGVSKRPPRESVQQAVTPAPKEPQKDQAQGCGPCENRLAASKSMSIWDAQKTQSIVSERTPSEVMRQQEVAEDLNRIQSYRLETSQVQDSLKMESYFKNAGSSYYRLSESVSKITPTD